VAGLGRPVVARRFCEGPNVAAEMLPPVVTAAALRKGTARIYSFGKNGHNRSGLLRNPAARRAIPALWKFGVPPGGSFLAVMRRRGVGRRRTLVSLAARSWANPYRPASASIRSRSILLLCTGPQARLFASCPDGWAIAAAVDAAPGPCGGPLLAVSAICTSSGKPLCGRCRATASIGIAKCLRIRPLWADRSDPPNILDLLLRRSQQSCFV